MGFDTLEKQILASPDVRHGSGATRAEIANAERRLRFRIGGGYRQFLERFGWVEFAYEDIYGLGADVPTHLNLTEVTLSERSEMEPRLPEGLLPVMNDGGGNHYCIDLRKYNVGGIGDAPVVFWCHNFDDDQVPEAIAPSFVEWLSSRLNSSAEGNLKTR